MLTKDQWLARLRRGSIAVPCKKSSILLGFHRNRPKSDGFELESSSLRLQFDRVELQLDRLDEQFKLIGSEVNRVGSDVERVRVEVERVELRVDRVREQVNRVGLRAEEVGSKGNRVRGESSESDRTSGEGLEMYQAGLQPEPVRDGGSVLVGSAGPQRDKALPYRRMLEKGQRPRLGSRRTSTGGPQR
jgi:hypothetical protein